MMKRMALGMTAIALAGCEVEQANDTPPPTQNELDAEAQEPRQSIIRDEVRQELGIEDAQQVAPAPRRTLTIGFAEGGSKLNDSRREKLDKFAEMAAENPDLEVYVWGHSDSRGAQNVIQTVAQERADAVADYLEGQGIAADRLQVVSLGDHNPVAPNRNLDGSENDEGQAKNRRVVLRLGDAQEKAADTTSAPTAE